MELRQSGLNFVCSRIPQDVRRFMVEGRGLMLAGGFIRSVIEGSVPKDLDFFGPSRDYALTGEKVELSMEVVNDSRIKPVDIPEGKEEGGESWS